MTRTPGWSLWGMPLAPYELMAHDGSIHISERSDRPSIEQLRFLAQTLSPLHLAQAVPESMWGYTYTIMTTSIPFYHV